VNIKLVRYMKKTMLNLWLWLSSVSPGQCWIVLSHRLSLPIHNKQYPRNRRHITNAFKETPLSELKNKHNYSCGNKTQGTCGNMTEIICEISVLLWNFCAYSYAFLARNSL